MSELPDEVITAIRAGHKFAAIKLLRTKTGMGLKESKETIERYAQEHNIHLRQAEVSTQGCLGVVGVIGLVAYLIYYFFFR